jgi:hypothetical protein
VKYYANVAPRGAIRRGMVPVSIGVLESPINNMPIGQASCFRWDDRGLAVWRLTVGGHELPGEFIIVDREFQRVSRGDLRGPAQSAS